MEFQLAMVADAANLTGDGRLNVLGEFDTLVEPGMPSTIPVIRFVAKLRAGVADIGEHRIMVRVVDEDGELIIDEGMGSVRVEAPAGRADGEARALRLIVHLREVVFPRYGTYSFELRINDLLVAEVPVTVRAVA